MSLAENSRILPPSDEDARFKANLPRLLYTSFSFLVLFCSYQATQGLVTSIFTSVGNISLATLNVCYALACIFGPTVVEKIGVKRTLVASALCYCVWVAAVIPGIPALFVAASALQGTASGFIWISHGVYMAGLAQGKSTGRYNSVFLTIFFLSVPIGNLFAGILFIIQNSTVALAPTAIVPSAAPVAVDVVRPPLFLLLALLGLVFIGGVMFFFIRLPDTNPAEQPNAPAILKTLKLLLDVGVEKRTLFFYVYYVWSGLELAFAWSRLPRFLEVNVVPWAFVSYGIGLFIGSMTLGRLYDAIGWKPITIINFVIQSVPYLLLVLIEFQIVQKSMWLIFFCSFCFGGCETLFNTFIQSTIMKYYTGERLATAFSIWRVVAGVFLALGYVMLEYLQTNVFMALSQTFLVVGLICIACLELFVSDKSSSKSDTVSQTNDDPVI